MSLYPHGIVTANLKEKGYFFLDGKNYQLGNEYTTLWNHLIKEWEYLPSDNYLEHVDKNFDKSINKIYRFRRWGQFLFNSKYNNLTPLPYSPFTQHQVAPGIERELAPWLPRIYQNSLLHEFIRTDYNSYKLLLPEIICFTVNVHLIRIMDGIPSPEGKHKDDVFFFSIRLINLSNASGGEAEIYSAEDQSKIYSISLKNKLDSYFINDNSVFHMAKPISRINTEMPAIRDILIISFLHAENL